MILKISLQFFEYFEAFKIGKFFLKSGYIYSQRNI